MLLAITPRELQALTVRKKNIQYCKQVMTHLTAEKEAEWFIEPVEHEDTSDYYKIIRRPIWINAILSRLTEAHSAQNSKYTPTVQYRCVADFVRDLNQMWINAVVYNGTDSTVSAAARKLAGRARLIWTADALQLQDALGIRPRKDLRSMRDQLVCARDEGEEYCAVCANSTSQDHDQIVFCADCGIGRHQQCDGGAGTPLPRSYICPVCCGKYNLALNQSTLPDPPEMDEDFAAMYSAPDPEAGPLAGPTPSTAQSWTDMVSLPATEPFTAPLQYTCLWYLSKYRSILCSTSPAPPEIPQRRSAAAHISDPEPARPRGRACALQQSATAPQDAGAGVATSYAAALPEFQSLPAPASPAADEPALPPSTVTFKGVTLPGVAGTDPEEIATLLRRGDMQADVLTGMFRPLLIRGLFAAALPQVQIGLGTAASKAETWRHPHKHVLQALGLLDVGLARDATAVLAALVASPAVLTPEQFVALTAESQESLALSPLSEQLAGETVAPSLRDSQLFTLEEEWALAAVARHRPTGTSLRYGYYLASRCCSSLIARLASHPTLVKGKLKTMRRALKDSSKQLCRDFPEQMQAAHDELKHGSLERCPLLPLLAISGSVPSQLVTPLELRAVELRVIARTRAIMAVEQGDSDLAKAIAEIGLDALVAAAEAFARDTADAEDPAMAYDPEAVADQLQQLEAVASAEAEAAAAEQAEREKEARAEARAAARAASAAAAVALPGMCKDPNELRSYLGIDGATADAVAIMLTRSVRTAIMKSNIGSAAKRAPSVLLPVPCLGVGFKVDPMTAPAVPGIPAEPVAHHVLQDTLVHLRSHDGWDGVLQYARRAGLAPLGSQLPTRFGAARCRPAGTARSWTNANTFLAIAPDFRYPECQGVVDVPAALPYKRARTAEAGYVKYSDVLQADAPGVDVTTAEEQDVLQQLASSSAAQSHSVTGTRRGSPEPEFQAAWLPGAAAEAVTAVRAERAARQGAALVVAWHAARGRDHLESYSVQAEIACKGESVRQVATQYLASDNPDDLPAISELWRWGVAPLRAATGLRPRGTWR